MKIIKTIPYIPTNVEVENLGPNKVRVIAYPFEAGYAITLAHPLRRLLLSSSVGLAPIALKIENVTHEFDSIRGIVEDVSPFIVNLKNIRFLEKNALKADEKIFLEYSFQGPLILTGAHLVNEQIDVVNKEAVLATINEDATLKFSVIVQRGIGYVPSEDIRVLIPEDYIPLDAYFTPVRKAVYEIENVLVEDNPTYEKIIFDIETDGQINPHKAFQQAIAIMHSQMSIFDADMSSIPTAQRQVSEDNYDFKDLLIKIDSLSLTARCFNCLDRIGIRYIGELVMMSENDLKNIKNMGKKSYDEIAEKLQELGYPVGTELEEDKKTALGKKIAKLKS